MYSSFRIDFYLSSILYLRISIKIMMRDCAISRNSILYYVFNNINANNMIIIQMWDKSWIDIPVKIIVESFIFGIHRW